MALVLDATVGGSSANSYCTRAEGDTYHEAHLYATAWTGATSGNKDAALVWATRMLDEQIEWAGEKTTVEQALRWPRGGAYDRDGIEIDSEIIPTFLKHATAELARYLLSSDRQATLDSSAGGVESVKAGSVEVKFDKLDRIAVLPDSVMAMIRSVVNDVIGGSNTVKLVRV